MAKLIWGEINERVYELGVSRGVLYSDNAAPVPWNGLASVTISADRTVTPIYFDGVKRYDFVEPGDFKGTIRAITYPDELEVAMGLVATDDGIFLDNQMPRSFGLSYTTNMGNGVTSEYGEKIHVLYNLTAVPSDIVYNTMSAQPSPVYFEWAVTATPEILTNHRPTARVIFDKTRMSPASWVLLEDTLYGKPNANPYLPPLSDLLDLLS